MSAIRIIKLAGAVALAGVAGTIYYIIRRKLDTGWGTEEVAVPNDVVGRFIGRKGANVKLIEAKTQTKIHFKDVVDNKGSQQVCVIRGPVDRLWLARSLVEQSVQKLCAGNTVQHVDIPADLTGGIIGARGHRINEIMHNTGTHITVERRGDAATESSRRVEVRGSLEGVEAAVRLLQDRVQMLQLAEARRSVTPTAHSRAFCTTASQDLAHQTSVLHPENSSSDVYVCSVSSATSLYVQLVSPKLEELNTMVEEMTSFYSQADNRLPISSTRQGIVAALYPFDNRWYRAWQVGHSGEGVATRRKKRSNPSGAAPTTDQEAKHNCFQKNNSEEGAQNGCHSLFSTTEINGGSTGSHSVSSDKGNGHLPNVERNNSTQCDNSLYRCDSLKQETKAIPGNVDLKTTSRIEPSDRIQTESASSCYSVACDDESLELTNNNHNTEHSSRLAKTHDSDINNSEGSLIPAGPGSDRAAKPVVAGDQDVWHTTVFFVDYGDYALVPSADLCDLRTDFLSLSHQAFMVHLAGVVPVDHRSLEAQYHLSNLTRCSEWQPITAKIVGYQHSSTKFDGDSRTGESIDELSRSEDRTIKDSIKTKLDVLYSMLREIVSEEDTCDEEDLKYDSVMDYDTVEKNLFDSLQTLNNLTSQLRLRESRLALSQMHQNKNKTEADEKELSKLVALTNELRLHLHPNSDQDSNDDQCTLNDKEVHDTPAVIAELTNKIAVVNKKHHLYQLLQRVLCCGEADLKRVVAGGGPIPLVRLFVNVDGQDIDVAEDMVSKGLLHRNTGLSR